MPELFEEASALAALWLKVEDERIAELMPCGRRGRDVHGADQRERESAERIISEKPVDALCGV